MTASVLSELNSLALAGAQRWAANGGRDVTLSHGVSLARCWNLLHWVEIFRPLWQYGAEVLAPDTGITALGDSPLRARVRATLAAQGHESSLGGPPLSGARTYEWSSPEVGWGPGKLAVAAALNLHARLRSNRRPRVLMASYPSLRALTRELDVMGAQLVMSEFTRSEMVGLFRAGAEIFTAPRHAATADAEAAVIRRAWDDAKAVGSPQTLFTWRGASLWDAVEPELDAWFQREVPALAAASAAISRGWPQPDVVVLASDGDPYQALLAQHAALRGVPSVILQHGLPLGYDFPLEERLTSHMMVWGPGEAMLYPAGDVARREFAVTGNPSFDRYAVAPPPTEGPIRRVLLLTSPANRISLGASAAEPARHIETLAAAFEGRGNFEVTLKLHPSESERYYRELCANLGLKWRLEKSAPLSRLLSETDLMIGSFSTSLLEAMLAGVPLAPAHFSAVPLPPPFDGSFGLRTLRTAEEARALLTAAESDPTAFRRERLSHYGPILDAFAGPRDGGSSVRAAKAVLSMARR